MAKRTSKAELAKRYAQALFQDAAGQDAADTVAEEFRGLCRLMDECPEFRTLMTSRFVCVKDRLDVAFAVADKLGLSVLMRNFLGVIIENGRQAVFPEMETAYRRLYEEYKGILAVSVVSARELDENMSGRLSGILNNIFEKDIRLDVRVDPALIGGLTVQVGSVMVDASIKSKLQKLNLVMKGVGV